MVVAGIMTGTSVDAIDVAICEIEEQGDWHSIALLSFSSSPFPEDLRDLILECMNEAAPIDRFAALPFQLAHAYADAFKSASASLTNATNVEAIGAHGQTIWHQPPYATWQALSGSALSALTKTRVVHDFRSADLAVGGQGAPLVPLFDVATLSTESQDRVALNIGGMANITLLPKSSFRNGAPDPTQSITAFDTGPGNVLIDVASQRFYGKKFDDGGKIARAGVVIQPMLDAFLALPYFQQTPPKSTGRELFNEELVMQYAERYRASLRPSEDVVATMTELTALTIARDIQSALPTASQVVVSGGGANNGFLLERLGSHLPNCSVVLSDTVGIPTQAKEAMAFAYFAWRTLKGWPSNMPSVTGAARAVVLGSVSFA